MHKLLVFRLFIIQSACWEIFFPIAEAHNMCRLQSLTWLSYKILIGWAIENSVIKEKLSDVWMSLMLVAEVVVSAC